MNTRFPTYSYPAKLEQRDNDGFLVTFRDVPEATSYGATAAEALENAKDTLTGVLVSMLQEEEKIPSPSVLETGEVGVIVEPQKFIVNREDAKDFLIYLGASIKSWQHVESNLYGVYSVLTCGDILTYYNLAARERTAIHAAFHSVVNFNIRLGMTTAAAEARLADAEQLKEWKKLEEKCLKKAKLRNKLVHHTLATYYDDKEGAVLELVPNIWDPLANRKEKFHRSDIETFAGYFDQLAHELADFREKVKVALLLPSQ